MKLSLRDGEVRITYAGSNETSYVRTLIERLNFIFKPIIVTTVMGITMRANTPNKKEA